MALLMVVGFRSSCLNVPRVLANLGLGPCVRIFDRPKLRGGG
jgi:hypothetical protein